MSIGSFRDRAQKKRSWRVSDTGCQVSGVRSSLRQSHLLNTDPPPAENLTPYTYLFTKLGTRTAKPATRNSELGIYYFIHGGSLISPIAIDLGNTTTRFPACH
jgi:hypothetical protein